MPGIFGENKILNGTFGRVWINDSVRANIKNFEAKVTLTYEAINVSDDLGTYQKYMGWEGAGTATFHKYDSAITSAYAEGIKTGVLPDVNIVGRLSDPQSNGAERVKFTGVTFDEIALLKFEGKTVGEEEIPFKFSGYELLDLIA